MPQNLDAYTRDVIVQTMSLALGVLSTASLYAQLVAMRLRSRNLKSSSSSRPSPPLLFGCLASLALMLMASALLTYPIIGRSFGGKDESRNDHIVNREISSSINFCEEDFFDSDYIAEPANTASSLASYCPLALLGIYGPPRAEWSSHVAGHKRFLFAYITLLVIGLGSTTLHSLLTASAQGADELPMLWFMACLSFCAIDIVVKGTYNKNAANKDSQRWLHWAVGISAVIATAIYVFSRDNFVAFYIMFFLYNLIALVGVITICFIIQWNDDAFRANVLLPLAVCSGWVAILAVSAWLSELVLCADVTQHYVYGKTIAPWIWNRAVHPLWHCSTALLAWLLIQVLLAGQGLQRGWGEPRLRWCGAPYVIFYKPAAVLAAKRA